GAAPGTPRPPREQGTQPFQRPRAGTSPRPALERTPRGSIGPRPRPGGISLPAATIGLFVLAVVVVAIAFVIQSVVGGDDNGSINPADALATQNALRSQTPGGAATGTTAAGETATPGNGTPTGETPGATGTPNG